MIEMKRPLAMAFHNCTKYKIEIYWIIRLPSFSRILIVDDDQKIRAIVREVLEQEKYVVCEAPNGSEAISQITSSPIDLILLDLGLPDIDGISLVYALRKKSDAPIIMVTGRGEVTDKIIGLESGAEDYITKPFHLKELVARIRTALRRVPNIAPQAELNSWENNIFLFNGWQFNFASGHLSSPEGQNIYITSYEYRIIFYFITNPNTIVTREKISSLLSGEKRDPVGRNIDVLIGRIRKKFCDSSSKPTFIQTIRNQGYMFIATVEIILAE